MHKKIILNVQSCIRIYFYLTTLTYVVFGTYSDKGEESLEYTEGSRYESVQPAVDTSLLHITAVGPVLYPVHRTF